MKFWDASAIVPLLVAEPTTRPLQALAERDPEMLVWSGSEVECSSALTRLERSAALDMKRPGPTRYSSRQLSSLPNAARRPFK